MIQSHRVCPFAGQFFSQITVLLLLAILSWIVPFQGEALAEHTMKIPSFDYPYVIPDDRLNAEDHLNQGLSVAYRGNWQAAALELEQAVAVDPTYEMAYRYLGDIYQQMGNLPSALDAYSHALEYNPYFSRLYNSRGEVQVQLGEYDQAIADFTKAIEVYPEDPIGYYNRGVAYTELQRYPQALADLRTAIETSEVYAEAYVQRGAIKEAIQNEQGAIADYRTAADLYLEKAQQQKEQGNESVYQSLKARHEALTEKVRAFDQAR